MSFCVYKWLADADEAQQGKSNISGDIIKFNFTVINLAQEPYNKGKTNIGLSTTVEKNNPQCTPIDFTTFKTLIRAETDNSTNSSWIP